MLTTLRAVAISFSIIIIRFFIQNINRSETLYTTQQQIAVADGKLHYYIEKIVTTSKIENKILPIW